MIDLLTIRPQYYERDYIPEIKGYSVAADRLSLKIPQGAVNLGSVIIPISEQELVISNSALWDDAQYATAANRAGKNFYIYATTGGLLLSANSTYPTGYSASTAVQIGGFHCVCLGVGTISGHPLTGYLTGDLLPDSIWDVKHRPVCDPKGMVYSDLLRIWVDIYLQSGTGASTASVFGGTITNSRNWMDFVDDLAAVKKRMLRDIEFQVIAAGSNEETNITGSAYPVTTGGHTDTAGRRMVSNIGCEDCCGIMLQWLDEQTSRNDDSAYSGSWGWYDLSGSKGSLYKQGGTGDAKLVAGGAWTYGSYSGSRCRSATYYRWLANSAIGSRGCARSQA